ncbi:MAG: phosphoglucosamine mutase [Bacteroidetes bacterium GWA2_32_17]|nr:MAG: phosphoglucosamine mutase [Bacteroidetes bacterium GWA2_32_17]
MSLIKSISGIRGTIGGLAGDNLTPADILKFTTAYCQWIKEQTKNTKYKIIIGRDARISGPMAANIIIGTLTGCGIDVIDLGLASTPTVEMAVILEKADGGIIITASHNPKHWNALKLLNNKGEFLPDSDGNKVLKYSENKIYNYSEVDKIGNVITINNYNKKHIDKILKLSLVDIKVIEKANFTILVDGINSVGSQIVRELLMALKVKKIIEINNVPNGNFAHNPEPLPENLKETIKKTVSSKADLGIVVDPDVDRLAFICEEGTFFGEEYTLVSVADYVLSKTPGNTVSNLSSSGALRDITIKHKGKYTASSVGEVNVVKTMKNTKAIIGGEGNGGVIYPELHYGRDALVGIALFLTHLAKSKMTCSKLRKTLPDYFISKNKIELKGGINADKVISKMQNNYKKFDCITIDGLRINFDKEWVHLRKSNTEPVIRIYAESNTLQKAIQLAKKIMKEIEEVAKQ